MEGKSGTILLILKVLEKYSDENHPLSQQDIIDKVEQEYGICLERKSVSKHINALIDDFDYDIEHISIKDKSGKNKKIGYALINRMFETSEIKFLVDAIYSSKMIPGNYAKNLAKKLYSTLSDNQQSECDYSYIISSNNINRTDNKEIFNNIELIQKAIVDKKKINFKMKGYDENGKSTTRKDGRIYTVSPYYLVNNDSKYYMICNPFTPKYGIKPYRLDNIIDVEIIDEPSYPLNNIDGYKNFNISEYLNENIYMYGGPTISATLEFKNSYTIAYIKEYFGNNARIYKKDDKLYADIKKCNRTALTFWVLQYSKEVTLISPSDLVNEIKDHLTKKLEDYSKL
jgi:predicted DNA-binding transcriptional regulator YafY